MYKKKYFEKSSYRNWFRTEGDEKKERKINKNQIQLRDINKNINLEEK